MSLPRRVAWFVGLAALYEWLIVTATRDEASVTMSWHTSAFGLQGARIALAVSHDAYTWRRLGLVRFPDEVLSAVDNKDAAFFPEPVWSPSGIPSFAFFHRPMRPETIDGQTPSPIILSLPPAQREQRASSSRLRR